MPDKLKSLLVDDWENITKNLQLVQLPSTQSANIILDKYLDHAVSNGKKSSTERDILEEVVSGMRDYFNKSLGRLLLYRFEREQFYDIYQRIESPTDDLAGKAIGDIYGGEHLLRLFGKSTSNPAITTSDSSHSVNARTHCSDEYGPASD
jgi:mortality factor 4-like protein 1